MQVDPKPDPPNYREITLPDCCGVCKFYLESGWEYPDSPQECKRFNKADFAWVCDGFERDE